MNLQTRPILLFVENEDRQLTQRRMLFEEAGLEFLGVQSVLKLGNLAREM
jgi:hypothetical protein